MTTLTLSSPEPSALSTNFQALAELPAETLWLANFHSDNTRDAYRHAISTFLSDLGIGSAEQLYAVGQAHVLAWRTQLRSEGKSNATINQHLSALSSLFKFLTDRQLCSHNPVTGVLRPNTGAKGIGANKTPALTRRQALAMLDAPMNPQPGQRRISELQQLRDRALLYIYFITGARCSEPGKLKVKDFRQDQGFWVLELQAKGEKTNIVAIADAENTDDECVTALLAYLHAAGHGGDPEAYMFQAIKNGKPGQPLNRKTFYAIFKKYVTQIGLPDTIVPHSARTTFITHCFEMGIPGEDIQRTVGHVSITTTEGYNQSAKKLRKSASLLMRY